MSISYIIFMLPALLLAGLATLWTHVTFNRYARQRASSGMTGAEAAQRLLHSQGVYDVTIEPVRGFLSDHYDPTSKRLRLSPQVYGSDSLSAIGVACHEAGHALQHASGYAALGLRSSLVPMTQFSSSASYFLILGGMILGSLALIKVGIVLFTLVVVFSLVTLPVEWNASARAKQLMTTAGIVTSREQSGASAVLNAAFMTYVASAVTSLMTLLYYLLQARLIGGRRGD